MAYNDVFAIIMVIFIYLGIPIALGIICDRIVKGKGYPPEKNHGFLWGFFLHIIGLIVCLCKQPYVDPMLYRQYPPYPYPQQPYPPQQPYQQYPPQQYPPQQGYPQPYGQPQYQPVPQPPQPGFQPLVHPYAWQCKACGAQNEPEAEYCVHCGAGRI